MQSMGRSNLLPMHTLTGHPADTVAAYRQLLVVSPTSSPNQPLLTITHGGHTTLVTVCMLARAFRILIKALGLDPGLYSLHSLRRGQQLWRTELGLTFWRLSGMACGPAMPSGTISHRCVLPPPQWHAPWPQQLQTLCRTIIPTESQPKTLNK